MATDVSKSWFCVFNNPAEHGFTGSPGSIADAIADEWIKDAPTRTCAVTYCISEDGLHHCHAVLEDTKALRFSAVKNMFPAMHIESTKGSKEQAEDYIQKRGKWQEKGEQVLYITRHGEIKGAQGQRRDLDIIDDLLLQGKTPSEIFSMSFALRRYEKMINQAYFDMRARSVPPKREVSVYWHVGESGSGKTYGYVKDCERFGENEVYLLTDYEKGGFDRYSGERILYMDEFRGQMRFAQLMNFLDGYKIQIPCRYANAYALWDTVHITTILPPEMVYQNMVENNRNVDTFEQLRRRIKAVVYHWKDVGGGYHTFEMPMQQYKDYATLKQRVILESGEQFCEIQDEMDMPF